MNICHNVFLLILFVSKYLMARPTCVILVKKKAKALRRLYFMKKECMSTQPFHVTFVEK